MNKCTCTLTVQQGIFMANLFLLNAGLDQRLLHIFTLCVNILFTGYTLLYYLTVILFLYFVRYHTNLYH